MEWAKLGVELVGHLAWPVAIVIIVLAFRGQVKRLLDPENLDSLEAGTGGFKINLKATLKDVRAKIEPNATPAEHAGLDHEARIAEIVKIDPALAVLASAAHFEATLRERFLPHYAGTRRPPVRELAQLAHREGLLTSDQVEGASSLMDLRNKIAHAYGHEVVAADEAIEFCDLAATLEAAITSED